MSILKPCVLLALCICSFVLRAQQPAIGKSSGSGASDNGTGENPIFAALVNMVNDTQNAVDYGALDRDVLTKFNCHNEEYRTSIEASGENKGRSGTAVTAECNGGVIVRFEGWTQATAIRDPGYWLEMFFWHSPSEPCYRADLAERFLSNRGWTVTAVIDEQNTKNYGLRGRGGWLSVSWIPKLHPYGFQSNVEPTAGCLGWVYTGASGAGVQVSPVATSPLVVPQNDLIAEDNRRWHDFLKLAAKPNAFITLDDVEAAFGEKLIFMSGRYMLGESIMNSVIYSTQNRPQHHQSRTDDIQVKFMDKDRRTCLPKSTITAGLRKTGWKFVTRVPGTPAQIRCSDLCMGGMPPRDEFLKGDQGVASVSYVGGCPTEVEVAADRERFLALKPLERVKK